MLAKRGDSVAQHGGTTKGEVLLGHGTAEPTAPTGGDNEGVYRCHARIYRTIRVIAIAAPMLQRKKIKANICLRAGQPLKLRNPWAFPSIHWCSMIRSFWHRCQA